MHQIHRNFNILRCLQFVYNGVNRSVFIIVIFFKKTAFGLTVELFVNLTSFTFLPYIFEIVQLLSSLLNCASFSFFQVKNKLPLSFLSLFGMSFLSILIFVALLLSVKHTLQFHHKDVSLYNKLIKKTGKE